MKLTPYKLWTKFEPDTRFHLMPVPRASHQLTFTNDLEILKERLLQEQLERTVNTRLIEPLKRAAHEAASLAWVTPYPLLFLPSLMDEKIQQAKRQTAKQARIDSQSQHIIALAA